MSERKKLSPTRRLVLAMDRCAVARGEAQWTRGYRTGRNALKASTIADNEDERMWQKELKQWDAVGDAEKAFERLARQVIREVRRG